MTRVLAVLAALTALAMGLQAVRDHASLIREGYEVSTLERKKVDVETEAARVQGLVSRLSSPNILSAKARELGLVTDYPEGYPVVRVTPDRRASTVVVKGD